MEPGDRSKPSGLVIEVRLPRLGLPDVARLADLLRSARSEIAIVTCLTLAAAVLRLVLLDQIPAGLHGDEAWTGLNAWEILHKGWIGPYASGALGYPSGPLYFAAVLVKVLPDTIFTVRCSMALLGIATIPVAYLAFRAMFDRTLATIAASLLVVSAWHLHFSRIAFPVISWPFIEVVVLLFLFLAIKTERRVYYGAAGMALGAGIYTYNVYLIFLVPVGLFIVWLAAHKRGPELMRFAYHVALMGALAIFVALPMINYIRGPGPYLNNRGQSLLQTEEWKSSDFEGKSEIVFHRTRDFFLSAFWRGQPDFADGAGSQAMVDRVSVALMAIGAVVLLWRWRQPSSLIVFLMVAVLPFGSIFTIDGLFRRSLGMVPFLVILAATPLAIWWRFASTLSFPLRSFNYAGIAVIFAAIAFMNLNYYFAKFPDTDAARYTFGQEYTDAVLRIRDLPGNPYVYFYSQRWNFFYETRLYLGPNMKGEDRSLEYSENKDTSLQTDRKRDVVYVFLGVYMRKIDEVERLYPGGSRFQKTNDRGEIEFRGYYLPGLKPGETPAAPLPTFVPTPTSTPRVGGDVRDRTRIADLERIQRALAEYKRKHGSYPSNGGGIQTLCTYVDNDAGCKLKEVMSLIPYDPLGEAADNGYFYASDGRTYAVYGTRETELFPACPDHPDHLARIASVLCVKGP